MCFEIIKLLESSFIEINDLLRFTNSSSLSEITQINCSGDDVKKLDEVANNILKENLKKCKDIRLIASEEEDSIIINNPEGKYMITYDPIDGSSNIKNDITVGSIFCLFKYDNDEMSGNNIVMAGYCLYSSCTKLILCMENRMNIYQLNQNRQFTIIKENYKIPVIGDSYAINQANQSKWCDKIVSDYIQKMILHKKTQRWVGSLVADAHRVIMSGGVFIYPCDNKNKNGKIRLLYEAYPMAYIFKSGGGFSSDGNVSILDLKFPENIHQKIPIFLFSKTEYELFQLT